MKRQYLVKVLIALLAAMLCQPIYAAGGKNHGDVGQGTVDQGTIGSETGNAPGSDAKDNQSDS